MNRFGSVARWLVVLLAGLAVAAHDPNKPVASSDKLHDDPEIHRALVAWRSGNLEEAAAILRNAARARPDSFDYWAQLGRLQLQRGEDGPNVFRFGNQVAARPLDDNIDVDAWRREKLVEALGCFEKLAELQRDYTVAYGYQVICLLGLGRVADAEMASRRAIEVEPNDSQWQLQLAAVLRISEKLDEAAVVLDRAEALAPRSGSVHQERLRLAQARKLPTDTRDELRLRAIFFSYLHSESIAEYCTERALVAERFGGGRSGIRAPDDVTNAELLETISEQAREPDDFAVDLWLSVLHHDNHDPPVADAAAEALARVGPEINDRLFWVLMNTPDSNATQRRVARMLAERKDERILEPLLRFLPYDIDVWPIEAATALAKLGDERAVPALCGVCRATERAQAGAKPIPPEAQFGYQMNRRRCVSALRHFETAESLETLEQMRADSDMRSTALASLYFLKHDRNLLDELASMLEGPQATFLAVHDLALLNDEAAWQLVLERGSKSDNEQVRAHTARAIRYAAPTEARRPAFVATLEKLANDSSRIVAQEARRGLEKLATP